eukprot:TRINITY_DN2932_c0_g1_i1.p1 TRINITY_DN2932_c0_g1~~TRINITY_DN2932_c0_g1_i1.p1  ORF type:complete len:146 (-),score=26.77 TRINITY_DN2932_c0_g1_i1:26-430(-)
MTRPFLGSSLRTMQPIRFMADAATPNQPVQKDGARVKWANITGTASALVNWGIPIAAIASLQRDPATVDPIMTTILAGYSMLFMRWSVAVYPRNYVLFACHCVNAVAQSVQVLRCAGNKLGLIKSPTGQENKKP